MRGIKYRRWRKIAIPTAGIVGELKNVTTNYDRKGRISSFRYNDTFKIIHDSQEFDNVYSEDAKSGTMPITRPGQKINILWSANDHTYFTIDGSSTSLPEDIKQISKFYMSVALRTLRREH